MRVFIGFKEMTTASHLRSVFGQLKSISSAKLTFCDTRTKTVATEEEF